MNIKNLREQLAHIASELEKEPDLTREIKRTGGNIGFFDGGSVSLWYIIETEERYNCRRGEIAIYDLSKNGLCLKIIDSSGYVSPKLELRQINYLEKQQDKMLAKLQRVVNSARTAVLKEVAS